MEEYVVNGLQLPPLLVALLQQGRWQHPGDEVLRRLIPFFRESVDFLTAVPAMRRESSGFLADEPRIAKVFHEARGSKSAEPLCLPWLDVELAVFVAVNRVPGDDLGIALDYRTGVLDPRVVASDWDEGAGGCIWREVATSFSEFVRMLGV
ncbi:MAG TPA: hypothetical protein VK395_15880 [Gemmataceae bacterium]|nr:hypothetical protein [Gemmataceae bacterium]